MNKPTQLILLGLGSTLVAAATLVACNNGPGSPGAQDTPTSGHVAVSADETFAPIMQAQLDTFGKLYPNAHVTMTFQPEEKVMLDLMNDAIKVAVVPRELTSAEVAEFKKQTIVPQTIKVGIDGLAIVLNRANPDSLLTVSQLRDIYTGKTNQWSQVSGKKTLGGINVVFDNNRSSTSRFVRDSVTRGAALTPKAYAAASNPGLLDYVATHPNAVGIVGVSWISDQDDPKSMSFMRKVRVASITARPNPTANDFIQPYQVYLAEKTPAQLANDHDLQNYPLRRNLYLIRREARAGLGTGFSSFVAQKNGQLIFQKSGLLPAQMQARIVTTPKL